MNILRQNTDYALRVMVNLARNYDKHAVSARILARQEDISYQFACKILQQLHKAKLVDSSMGPKGGFSLSRPPDEVEVINVIEAIQGPIKLNKCLLDTDACPRQPRCPVSAKLLELQKHIENYLHGITLDQFLKRTPKRRKKVKRARSLRT
jgi:Rrf2 family protein